MPISSLARRAISSRGSVEGIKVHQSQVEGADWERVSQAVHDIYNDDQRAPIYLTNASRWRAGAICSEARRTASKGPLGLIIVDYLQLLKGDRKKYSSDEREIADISGQFKDLAVELDVPVMLLSQLNRNLESRPNKRPIMADLRQSGAIEQDADIIMFLYRDEVYNPESDQRGLIDIDVVKNRNGPIGRATLRWTPEYTRFDNLTWRSDE
jgi:replicative DNA helicase